MLAQVYRYDQLNRLKKSQGVLGLTASTNSWNGVNDPVAARYRSTYAYDANGNILHADRWDQDGHRYDSLYYRYQMNGGHLTRNRLYQLLDLADASNAYANDVHDLDYQTVDIIDQGDAASHVNVKNNYGYDPIGNLVKDSLEQIQHIDWTAAGKVRHIERTTSSTKPELWFAYGADGQRSTKTVGDPTDGGYREHYIRDAQGNIMAIYQYKVGTSAALYLMDQPIYGSKRLGSYTELRDVLGMGLLPVNYTHTMQAEREHYELTDHLGNVAAVVTGRLLPVSGSGYQAELVSAQGYESFGSLLPGRNYSSDAYRFGFQGQIKDDEVYGAIGTAMTAEFWEYDTRTARRWNLDPVPQITISDYSVLGLNPILKFDPKGDGYYYTKEGGYLGDDKIKDDKAYTVSGTSRFNVKDFTENGKYRSNIAKYNEDNGDGFYVELLNVKHSELLKLAGVSYAEASQLGDKKEIFAIASSIENKSGDKSIDLTLTGNYSYAMQKDKYKDFMNSGLDKSGTMQMALAGALNAVTGGMDYSNSATNWDGIDVLSGGASHYRQKKAAYDSRIGLFDPSQYGNIFYVNAQEYACSAYGVNGKVYRSLKPLITVPASVGALWQVTATYGGSIFYKEIPKE